jgi:hypothetical protein
MNTAKTSFQPSVASLTESQSAQTKTSTGSHMGLARMFAVGMMALALTAVLPSISQADVLGQHHPGMTKQQPQQPQQSQPQQVVVRHKRVVNVTTYLRHTSGNLSSVTWEITTHVWNGQTQQWQAVPWGATYIRALQGLQERGWSAYDAQSNNHRTVTGTW